MASVHAVGERTVVLCWEVPAAAKDGLRPRVYEIHASEMAALPPLWQLLRAVSADDVAAAGDAAHLVCTCDAPRARRTYCYAVRAVNAAGALALCYDDRFCTHVRGGVPSAVSRPRCESVRPEGVGVLLNLVWDAPADDGGVDVERFEARSAAPPLRHRPARLQRCAAHARRQFDQ